MRDAIAENDFKKAEKLVLDNMAENGTTPIAIEAFSWLGRGAVAAKSYDEAMTYAARTYEIVEEQLKTRKLDDEAAPADRARRGDRSAGARPRRPGQAIGSDHDAAARDRTVQGHVDHHAPQQEHEPAEPRRPAGVPDRVAAEWLGPKTSLAALKGKPVVLFLWAHWCGDCKTQGPILDALVNKYKSTRHHRDRADAAIWLRRRSAVRSGPAEELAYIEQIRDQFYPWMKTVSAPVSDDVYLKYGVSTTPTYVMIDRDGKVSTYLPGQPTAEQLEPLIQKITDVASSR